MPSFTPVYLWPYQNGTDRPDGPNLGEDALLAAEATVQGIASRVQQAEVNIVALQSVPVIYRDTIVTTGTVPSVTFSNIPATLKKLRIAWTARGDDALALEVIYFRINGDSGANYTWQYWNVNNVSGSGAFTGATNQMALGLITAAGAPAGRYGQGEAVCSGWDSPHASNLGFSSIWHAFGSGGAGSFTGNAGGDYYGAGPYTSITIFPQLNNLVVGSQFLLEGV